MVTLPSEGPSLLEGIFMDGQEVSDRVFDHTLLCFSKGMISGSTKTPRPSLPEGIFNGASRKMTD